MEGILILLAIVVGFVLLDVLAVRSGVDSRSESNDPHSPAGGLFAS